MFKIYDELTYAKWLEKNGFYAYFQQQSEVFSRSYDYWDYCPDEDGDIHVVNTRAITYCVQGFTEIGVMIRYYMSQGMKRKAVRENVIKCWKNYDGYVDYKYLDKALDRTFRGYYKRRKEDPDYKITLKDVNKMYINKKVLKWFINMPQDREISDEMLAEIKAHIGPKEKKLEYIGPAYLEVVRNVSLSTMPYIRNKIYCWNRAKFLWTMYVWYLLQKEAGYKHPERIYLKGSQKKFKDDANLPTHFSFSKESTLMCWTGDIEYVSTLGKGNPYYKLNFIDEINKILENDDEGEMVEIGSIDLYQCGEYLEHMRDYKKPAICPYCGRTFDKKSNRPNEGCKDEDCLRAREREKKQKQRSKAQEVQNDNM